MFTSCNLCRSKIRQLIRIFFFGLQETRSYKFEVTSGFDLASDQEYMNIKKAMWYYESVQIIHFNTIFNT